MRTPNFTLKVVWVADFTALSIPEHAFQMFPVLPVTTGSLLTRVGVLEGELHVGGSPARVITSLT